MPKYAHYITVPITTSIKMTVLSEDENPTKKDLYDLAKERSFQLYLKSDDYDIEMGESVSLHDCLNTGICYAAYPELTIDETEEI